MKMNPRIFCLSLIILGLSFSLLLPPLQAQPVVTPSPGTGSELGADWGPYNVTNSIESGYRFTTVGGDAHLFRSVENYGNGLRLFGGNFSAISKDGHGRFFDSLTLTSSGLGNDPYGMANLRVEKNDRYRYDLTWRRNDYFNASLLNGAGGTLKNTMRTVQDHDLTVSATRWAKLLLGYTRNHETGPEYSAYETYMGGLARSVLPIDRDTRREFNEYRLGTELDFLGFRLSLTHRWEYYKEDSSIVPLIPGQEYPLGDFRNQPCDASYPETYRQAATAYSRTQPMHGRNRGWFGNLIRNEKYWAINARMTYSKGDSTSVYYETASGNTVAKNAACNNCGFGAPVNAFTYMPGTARRPFTAGDFSFSLFPTSKLTIINSTSVQSNRFDG